MAFLFAVFRLYDPIRRVAILFNNNFQQARGASQEIFRFMDATDEVLEKPTAVPLPAFRDRIRFENVTFSYSNGDGDNSRDILHRWVDEPQLLWDGVYQTLSLGIETIIHVGPAPNIIPATYTRLAENVTSLGMPDQHDRRSRVARH